MLFALFFAFWRFMQIITLIPTMGMLAYFVHGYTTNNILTPDFILILFIVSVLGVAWSIFTLFSYHRSSANARFVGLIDLCFVGALIAAVYYQRFIADANCAHIAPGGRYDATLGVFDSASLNGFHVSLRKSCAMIKACFAFGIMNCVFFFLTAVLACFHGDRADRADRAERKARGSGYYREERYERSVGPRRHRSASHHSSSPRGSHSHSRSYV